MKPKPFFLCVKCAREMSDHCPTRKCDWMFCARCRIIYSIKNKEYLLPMEDKA